MMAAGIAPKASTPLRTVSTPLTDQSTPLRTDGLLARFLTPLKGGLQDFFPYLSFKKVSGYKRSKRSKRSRSGVGGLRTENARTNFC